MPRKVSTDRSGTADAPHLDAGGLIPVPLQEGRGVDGRIPVVALVAGPGPIPGPGLGAGPHAVGDIPPGHHLQMTLGPAPDPLPPSAAAGGLVHAPRSSPL